MEPSEIIAALTLPPNAPDDDPRLDAPAFHRNGPPIVSALRERLSASRGAILEVGGGTGQHVALLARCFPELTFWPSEPDAARRRSIDAWRAHLGLETVRPAVDLDVRAVPWALGPEAPQFQAVFCANVVHIAPWSVAEGLFRGARSQLAEGGFLALYGPFRWSGAHVSGGNEAFDAALRARDPGWGVRDVDDLDPLAHESGLVRTQTIAMPSNNHLLFFERGQAGG